MLSQMQDSAHDRHHIYRVLNSALDISNYETAVDLDVLIAACLLHDIGRERQFANLNLCHAQIGGDIAYEYLISRKWDEAKAIHVKKCISSHRYRRDNPPETIEAKILFDADKLDASGAIGIARTLIYEGQVSEPLYLLDDNENIIVDGGGAEISSFFQEYNYKLKKLYNAFNTERAKEIAIVRQKTAVDFYDGLFNEVSQNYKNSSERLSKVLTH
ncbi:MAG: HD domain-containing protein [Clostridiales bacterium]|nr:HD domain-containing protein [Clostridiales bacterium]